METLEWRRIASGGLVVSASAVLVPNANVIIVVVILVVVIMDASKVSSGYPLTIYMKRICMRGVS